MGMCFQRHAPTILLRVKNSRTHCTGNSVAPRSVWVGMEKRKYLYAPEFELWTVQPVGYSYTDYAVSACHYVTQLIAYIFSFKNFDIMSFLKELEPS
jgi:hypothetical protein